MPSQPDKLNIGFGDYQINKSEEVGEVAEDTHIELEFSKFPSPNGILPEKLQFDKSLHG